MEPMEAKTGECLNGNGGAMMEMPRYQCFKKVWALTIKEIRKPALPDNCEWDGSMEIVPVEDGYAPFKVSAEYMQKHNPQVGGMYVVYEDGYKSFSPKNVFDNGYTRIADA